jgi:hypothetical protein
VEDTPSPGMKATLSSTRAQAAGMGAMPAGQDAAPGGRRVSRDAFGRLDAAEDERS